MSIISSIISAIASLLAKIWEQRPDILNSFLDSLRKISGKSLRITALIILLVIISVAGIVCLAGQPSLSDADISFKITKDDSNITYLPPDKTWYLLPGETIHVETIIKNSCGFPCHREFLFRYFTKTGFVTEKIVECKTEQEGIISVLVTNQETNEQIIRSFQLVVWK